MTILNEELMRQFLIVLSKGEKIELPMDSLKAVGEDARIRFTQKGSLMVMSVNVVKDRWGRVVDRCGQVKCLKCDTYINYDYPDGSKRTLCAQHE